MQKRKGSPDLLGATPKEDGYNFAIFSRHAKKITLVFLDANENKILEEIPIENKTGDIWHIFIENLTLPCRYGYKIEAPHYPPKNVILSDPYAKLLSTSSTWGKEKDAFSFLGYLQKENTFDWQKVQKPSIAKNELIIYEMHVRSFTKDLSSRVSEPGTYKAVVEKIPYLKDLGINAVELMPVFAFNECENHRYNPKDGSPLYNVWGYSPINFFAPMNAFATDREKAIEEFKYMVRELHRNGIEVLLDVVYNHTAEGKQRLPINFKGIDHAAYYMLSKEGHDLNFSGCGNSVNVAFPVVQKMIIDSLHYWVNEMQVDGFRFDLASILTRDSNGMPLENPPLLQAINSDPVFQKVKLIAEPWDAGGLYQIGYFPRWDKFSEWNGKYRDIVRKFMKGTIPSGIFADALCGSRHIYHAFSPSSSINFVTAHDGFTLNDLVSYSHKHNEENGEENRDGMNHNDSWNYGTEGETDNPETLFLREKQRKNFLVALLVSRGIPMILMGDEYGHTRDGNNNTWCQDNKKNWFLWDQLQNNLHFFRFVTKLISFRKNHPILHKNAFIPDNKIHWHGIRPHAPNWSWDKRFVSYTLKDSNDNDLYIAFNSRHEDLTIDLPKSPEGKKWYKVIQTFAQSPEDFLDDPRPADLQMVIPSYSSFVAKAFE